MSAKQLTSEILKTIGKEINMDLEQQVLSTQLEKKLIRQIEEYGNLQWRLAHAHQEMFGVKNINDAVI